MKHTCEAAVLHCIDFRLAQALEEYKKSQNIIGDCDVISVAGAVGNIVNPKQESDREFVLRQLGLSKKLHDIKKIILINHTDCGAYGGAAAFPSKEEERAKHEADLHAAKELVLQSVSGAEVQLALAVVDSETGAVTIEAVQ